MPVSWDGQVGGFLRLVGYESRSVGHDLGGQAPRLWMLSPWVDIIS